MAGHINFNDSRKNKVKTVTEIYNGWVIADFRDLHQLAASTALEQLLGHSILTFVRTIFPGVWEVSVMRHGGQASDEIEDDLYQYNII